MGEAIGYVQKRLKDWKVSPKVVLRELEKLAAEFDAAVEADDDGFRYRFPAVRESFVEAELMRRQLKLQDQKLGRIVYATSDTGTEASHRDQAKPSTGSWPAPRWTCRATCRRPAGWATRRTSRWSWRRRPPGRSPRRRRPPPRGQLLHGTSKQLDPPLQRLSAHEDARRWP